MIPDFNNSQINLVHGVLILLHNDYNNYVTNEQESQWTESSWFIMINLFVVLGRPTSSLFFEQEINSQGSTSFNQSRPIIKFWWFFILSAQAGPFVPLPDGQPVFFFTSLWINRPNQTVRCSHGGSISLLFFFLSYHHSPNEDSAIDYLTQSINHSKGFPSDQQHCLIRSHGISNKLNHNLLLLDVPEKMHEAHGMQLVYANLMLNAIHLLH